MNVTSLRAVKKYMSSSYKHKNKRKENKSQLASFSGASYIDNSGNIFMAKKQVLPEGSFSPPQVALYTGVDPNADPDVTACAARASNEITFNNTSFDDFSNWETFDSVEAGYWVDIAQNSVGPLPFEGTIGEPIVNDGQFRIKNVIGRLTFSTISAPLSNTFAVQYWFPTNERYYPGTEVTWSTGLRGSGIAMYAEAGFMVVHRTTDGNRFFQYAATPNTYEYNNADTLYEPGNLTFTVPEEEGGYWVDYYIPFVGFFNPAGIDSCDIEYFTVSGVTRDETCPVQFPSEPDPYEAYVKWFITGENGFGGSGSFQYPLPFRGVTRGLGVDGFINSQLDGQDWGNPSRQLSQNTPKFGSNALNWNSLVETKDNSSKGAEYPGGYELYFVVDLYGLDITNYINNNTPGTSAYYESHFMPVIGTGDFTLDGWVRASYQLQKFDEVPGYTPGNTFIEQQVSGRAALFGLGTWVMNTNQNKFTDPDSPNMDTQAGCLLITADNELYWSKMVWDGNAFAVDARERITFGNINLRDGSWHFVSVSRNSGIVRCHVDGVYIGQGVDNRYIDGWRQSTFSSNQSAYTPCTIGVAAGTPPFICGDHRASLDVSEVFAQSSLSWQGQIDEFRYTAGIGRYGTNDNYALATKTLANSYPTFVDPSTY